MEIESAVARNRRIVARLRTVAVDGRPISFAARREATKTRQWTPRARARRRRRRKVGSRHTTLKDWNFVALLPSGGANHSHRSRVRAERRTVVVEIAPKRYVRALTTLARARESERTFFFAATRRSRGSRMGPNGESSPCGVPTDRRRDAARRACAPHDDCRRCARRAVDPDRSPNPRLFVSLDALFRESSMRKARARHCTTRASGKKATPEGRDIVNVVCVLVTRYLQHAATIRHPERERRRRRARDDRANRPRRRGRNGASGATATTTRRREDVFAKVLLMECMYDSIKT